jgi:hypothetical protein
MWWKKDKKKAPTPSSSSEEEKEEESDDEEYNQPSISSSEDEETIRRVRKVMGMIRKINLVGVLLQVEDLLFTLTGKSKKRGCFACEEKGHFRDSCPTMAEPKKGRSKGKALTSVKTWDDSSSKDEPPRTHSHRSSSRSSQSSHKCLIARGKTSIPSSSDDEGEGKPSIDKLAEDIKFFQDICTKQNTQLKTLKKNKLISSQNDYKGLLEKFETFANLNCEQSTKIEQLESSALSTKIFPRCYTCISC